MRGEQRRQGSADAVDDARRPRQGYTIQGLGHHPRRGAALERAISWYDAFGQAQFLLISPQYRVSPACPRMRRIGIENPAKRGRLADEAELYHQEFKVFGHRAGHSVGGQFGFFSRRAWAGIAVTQRPGACGWASPFG